MPCPWNDRKRFYEAAEYVDEYGERLLKHLTDYLNSVHSVSYTQRYWRILIGPWLLFYLHAYYDRYVRLVQAFEKYGDLQTIVMDPRSFWTPGDMRAFTNAVVDDAYNLQVLSQLLQAMGYVFPARALLGERHGAGGGDGTGQRQSCDALKDAAKWVLRFGSKSVSWTLAERRRLAISDLYVRPTMLWGLAWCMRFRAVPIETKMKWSFPLPGPAFDNRRDGLRLLASAGEFESLLVRSLPQNFPTLYMEGYHCARTEALRRYGKVPQIIVSATAWYDDEPFKYLAAEASQRGSRLVTVQSGGGYGIHRFSAAERHESRLADSFMVWGWAGSQSNGIHNLPSPKVSSLPRMRLRNRDSVGSEIVLFVSTAHLRYLLRFHSMPIGIQTDEYFQWQIRFLEAISDQVRWRLVFRPYPKDYGHSTRDRILNRYGNIRWDDSRSIYRRLLEARIVVVDHSGTTFLEALRFGVPTILFWDPHLTEVRDEAVAYFEGLRKVGILFNSPEEAAAKVMEVYEDPWAWWNSGLVEEVRQRFVERYALAREDWLECWVKALEEEIALSQVKKDSRDE
jgi:putative transferase (TIGR04331 family)